MSGTRSRRDTPDQYGRLIASGGVGEPKHILEVFEKTDVSAALAASIFHFNQYSIGTVKQYLKENNVAVRL